MISGNNGFGIKLEGAATGNSVQGNLIGTQADGTSPLGNTVGVVVTASASGNTIGGSAENAGNTIAYNGDDGVLVVSGTRNPILSNAIFSNVGLGIDLFPSDGVTANDAGDGDTGANNLQNFPVLASATSSSSSITIAGDLNSTATTAFRVEFFANTVGDLSGHGEGETFIGATTVTTDASGNASFTVTLSATVPAGQLITATATDPNNNTSEFSALVTVELPPFVLVEIDIKPGSLPNCIQATSKGTIPVAILASANYNVADVDVSTVRINGVAPVGSSLNKDVNGDTQLDLVLHFSTVALNTAGLLTDGNTLDITGALFDGTPIQGSDVIFLAGGPNCFD